MSFIVALDNSILYFIQDVFGCQTLDFLMPKITLLANGGLLWLLIAFVFVCTKKFRKCGGMMFFALLMGVIIGNVIMKPLIARARPCWLDSTIRLLISNPGDFSFPSGHTLSSFIAVTVMMLFNKKMGLIALPVAVLIAFSRMYLFVHFPTDVFAGVLLGITIGCLSVLLASHVIKRLHRRDDNPATDVPIAA